MDVWSEDELVDIRRSLHRIPEIGLEEFKTHEYLMAIIAAMPSDRILIKEWETAVLVKVKGKNPKKIIGWRTDIDGLPITEETGFPFSSTNVGKMHACGHDFHMTIALGLLQRIIYSELENDFVFIFQPAEENEAGGMLLYQSGQMDEWMPDEVYALHVQPSLPVGSISTRIGTLFAGTCEIHANFIGKGGHAAFPHESNDMIVAAAQFVSQVQTIVSRNVDPMEGAVVTFGTFNAGTTNNVIAGTASLSGTIRTLTYEMNQLTQKRIREIASGVALSFDCQVDLQLTQKWYLPVENNAETTTIFMDFMKKQPNVHFIEAKAAMTGEDFGFLLSKIPGTMFWLGVDSPYGLHQAKMNPKEQALLFAVDELTAFFKKIDKS